LYKNLNLDKFYIDKNVSIRQNVFWVDRLSKNKGFSDETRDHPTRRGIKNLLSTRRWHGRGSRHKVSSRRMSQYAPTCSKICSNL